MKRLGLMVSGNYPCVRVGKITAAMNKAGWIHDALGSRPPFQLEYEYRRIYSNTFMGYDDFKKRIAEHPAEIIHVHNEPNWPVIAAKEATDKPVIFNVHDVTSIRPDSPFDPYEEEAFRVADAYVFVSEEQRQFCIEMGFGKYMEGKHYAVLPCFVNADVIIDKTPLPHIGGLVYAGGLQKRNEDGAWRDLSALADLCAAKDVPLHLYPGNPGIDYGLVHETVLEYSHLIHAMARHDWGFTGATKRILQWDISLPNKVFEYMAAGIPFIAFNNPLVKPLCDAGCGVYVNKLEDVPRVVQEVDPKPLRKAVKLRRESVTMERNIHVITDLYEKVLENA